MNELKLTAKEAQALASGNIRGLNGVLMDIENCAKNGNLMMSCPSLSEKVVIELIRLGYAVSEYTDSNIGLKSTVISWR